MLVDCSDFRDSFCLCLLNSGTSFLSGFAIFSVLGYMSQKQGVDINSVAESGMKVIGFEMTLSLSAHKLFDQCIELFLSGLEALIECMWMSPSRTWPCVHSLPSSCHSSTVASALVCVLFYHDHPARNRWTSKLL